MNMLALCGRPGRPNVLLTGMLLLSQAVWAQKPAVPPAGAPPKADEVHQLWTTYTSAMLAKPIPTTSADTYYAGEQLMVPLHAAFKRGDAAWEKEFSDHFRRMVQARSSLTDVILSRVEYLYVASQFMVLAKKAGRSDLIPEALPDVLFAEIRDIWYDKPSPQYAHAPFKGMKERVLFKLDHRNLGLSFYRAITDEEMVVASMAADIRYFHGFERAAGESTLNDILSVTERICRQEIVHNPDGGWLLQPGVWTDHPDFQYAGNPRLGHGLHKAPVPSIGTDSSHNSRWALLLHSLASAYAEGSPQNRLYSELEAGLNTQFFGKVLTPPANDFPCYRLRNFMNGANGVYRYGYATLGADTGYGPYQNSAALPMGWWAFLETEESRTLYRKMADQFPWPTECIDLYLGPVPGGHERSKSDLDPNSSGVKFRYYMVRLASNL
jgi:hypothetical protein